MRVSNRGPPIVRATARVALAQQREEVLSSEPQSVQQRPPRSYYETNPFSTRWRSNIARMVGTIMPPDWDNMELLDLGVGDGYTIRLIKPKGKITGLDPDREAVAAARERGIAAQEGSAYVLPFPSESFGLVTCIEVLEHLSRPEYALGETHRILQPGGYLLITTPIPNAMWRTLWWTWTRLGPGKRWRSMPHVTNLRIGCGSSEEGDLVAMLGRLNFEVVRTRVCNGGMVAGLLALKKHGMA